MAQQMQCGIQTYGQTSRMNITNKLGKQSSKSMRTRKMKTIQIAEISKLFCRIWNWDFHSLVDKYHTPEQQRRN